MKGCPSWAVGGPDARAFAAATHWAGEEDILAWTQLNTGAEVQFGTRDVLCYSLSVLPDFFHPSVGLVSEFPQHFVLTFLPPTNA